ncbi:MAG: response regulator [Marinobacter sp.]|nr:response regulator [Marinobacter sp.]
MTTRILICDDSGMARKQMARALPPDWDTDITFAADGREGLERIREGGHELLFLDLNMPEMDGYEVLEAIKAEDLPILTIVVSGDIQPQAKDRVKKLGAIDFIKKPTDTQLVAQILADYGLYRPATETADTPASAPDGQPQNIFAHADEDNLSLADYLQEMSNVAMGRAADLLARLLNVFIKLPVPKVNRIERSELSMALSAAADNERFSGVCQGFMGAGLSGEALLLFADASIEDLGRLLHERLDLEEVSETEVLMDISSILFGAFLKGFSAQLDIPLGLSHPVVLGQHRPVNELLEHHNLNRENLLSIEITYEIEQHNICCDLLILLTEESVLRLEHLLQFTREDA